MKKKETTDVIFRVDTTKLFKGDVFALFPHEVKTSKGDVACYSKIGQHSGADYDHCIKTSRAATEEEAKELKNELERIGYDDLRVVKKRNYSKFLESYKNRMKL